MTHIQLIPQNAVDRLLAGDAEILFAAFTHGLTVNVRWPHWHYPLLHGLCHNCPKRVDEMLEAAFEAGASSIEEFEGLTPLMLAIGSWHPEHDQATKSRRDQVVGRLTEHAMEVDDTLVGAAAAVGYVGAIRMLKDAGCDLNARDTDGKTALHHAYRMQHLEAAQTLVSLGVNQTPIDDDGQTPLDWALTTALSHEQREIVKEFDQKINKAIVKPKRKSEKLAR